MRVAIVGAGGFIGRRLCAALEHGGDTVIRVSSSASAFDAETGLLDERALPATGLEAAVYLSQSPHYRDLPRRAPHLWAVNVVSAVIAAEWARRNGATRLIHASTGSVYAPSFAPHRESDPLRSDDCYALSKRHAEELLQLVPGLAVSSLRLFGVYGEGQQGKLVPALTGKVRSGEPIRLQAHPTDAADLGGLRLSMTYVDDAVRAMVHVLHHGGPPTLNVTGPDVLSVRDIAEAIGRHLGRAAAFEYHGSSARSFELIADGSLMNRLVGGPFVAFAQGIAATLDAEPAEPGPAAR